MAIGQVEFLLIEGLRLLVEFFNIFGNKFAIWMIHEVSEGKGSERMGLDSVVIAAKHDPTSGD